MKYFVILFFTLFSLTAFSQEKKKASYYFDYSSIFNHKNHELGSNLKTIEFRNTKDSDYLLNIEIDGEKKSATLLDSKNVLMYKFNIDFNYHSIIDLKKLNNAKLYINIHFDKPIINKNYIEEIEYENDSLTNNTIVHLTGYKNKKKKKIIREEYYFFENTKNNSFKQPKSIKNYLNYKYKINIKEDENLIKVLYLKNGKIVTESNFINMKSEDYTFEFKIDEIISRIN